MNLLNRLFVSFACQHIKHIFSFYIFIWFFALESKSLYFGSFCFLCLIFSGCSRVVLERCSWLAWYKCGKKVLDDASLPVLVHLERMQWHNVHGRGAFRSIIERCLHKVFSYYDRIPWGFDLSLWDFIIVGFVYLVCTQLPLLLLLLFPSPIKKKIVKEENYVTCLLQCMIFLSILYVGKACFADLYLCNLNGISTFIKVSSSSFFLSLLVNCCCSSLGESGILTSFSCLLQDYQMHVAQLH